MVQSFKWFPYIRIGATTYLFRPINLKYSYPVNWNFRPVLRPSFTAAMSCAITKIRMSLSKIVAIPCFSLPFTFTQELCDWCSIGMVRFFLDRLNQHRCMRSRCALGLMSLADATNKSNWLCDMLAIYDLTPKICPYRRFSAFFENHHRQMPTRCMTLKSLPCGWYSHYTHIRIVRGHMQYSQRTQRL